MKTSQLVCLTLILGLSAARHASASDITFFASGVFDDGSTLGGSLVIDTATGIVESTGVDLTVSGGSLGEGSLTFDTLGFGGEEESFGGGNLWYAVDATDSLEEGPFVELDLYLGPATSLVNYAGGPLCYYVPEDPTTNNCSEFYSSWQLLVSSESPGDPVLIGTSSSLSPVTVPEPASAWLLALPAAWVIRRQRRNAN